MPNIQTIVNPSPQIILPPEQPSPQSLTDRNLRQPGLSYDGRRPLSSHGDLGHSPLSAKDGTTLQLDLDQENGSPRILEDIELDYRDISRLFLKYVGSNIALPLKLY
jgi:hypothetical protein